MPLTAGSSDAVVSVVSDGLVFEVDNASKTATLVGSAATPPKGDLSIPASVASGTTTYELTAIANSAFAKCPELSSISLPATLREVDPDALAGCTSLKSITISPKNEAFTSHDGMLFTKDYSRLLLIPEGKEGAATIPGSTIHVPAQALSRCLLMGSSLTPGDGSTEFATFNGMLFSKDLKTLITCPPAIGNAIVLPAETETIGEYALAGCKDLASLTVLGAIRSIDPTAFADEAKASAVIALPAGDDYNSRKAVWEQAGFQHFAELAKPGTTTKPTPGVSDEGTASGLVYTLLDDYTFAVSWEGQDDPAAELDIPASAEINGVSYRVSTIAAYAFANCDSLASVKLPTTITTINNAAFAGCANLTNIELPNTLHVIGERAFEATSIKSLWLPASLESIDSRAFAACESLERVVALGTPHVASDALAGCATMSIYVPSGSEDTWNSGLPFENNHLMPYGISLSEEPLAIEAGQEADLLEGGELTAPVPVEVSYSYAAAPLSVNAGHISAKKAGTTDVTAVLALDGVELTRATRSVEVAPNPNTDAEVTLLNSETPLPSAYLASLRAASAPVSITAPISVIFAASGYDVSQPATSVSADATFVNTSSAPAYIEGLTCTDQGASTLLEAKPESAALDSQELFTLFTKADANKTVSFGYGDNVKSINSLTNDVFLVDAYNSLPCTFRLNLENASVKPSEADGGASVKGLANVAYTFTPMPLGFGKGTTELTDFYLEDKKTNQVYTLEQVKAHANAIAQGDEGIKSEYESFMANEDRYECKTTWGDVQYDVRVIGVKHDDKMSGGKAGLTFQFKECLGFHDTGAWGSEDGGHQMGYRFNDDPTYTPSNEGGWGASELRARMNPGIDSVKHGTDDNAIWNLVPESLQKVIAQVNKGYTATTSRDAKIDLSPDSLFIASYCEIARTSYWAETDPWTLEEGYQYEYWHQIVDTHGQYSELIKHSGSASGEPVFWWQRTGLPGYSTHFLYVTKFGGLSNFYYANDSVGVCPCFCL